MRSTLVLPFLLSAANAQLNTLAVAAGLKYFGSATDNSELTDTAYLALLSDTTDFAQITPGNGQKWDSVEKSQGVFTFTKGDEITALAAKNSQLVRCHTLVWYSQLPSWVSGGTWTNETLQAVMKNHITETMTHYKGQCYAWDVVNEAFDDTSAAAFRNSVFYQAMGEDYIRIAFETARLADPDVKLYYNDYNIEYTGAKAANALAMITKLVNGGTPIDGVGIQGHYIVGKMPTGSDITKNLEAYTALGLEVAITELDIRMNLPSTAADLAQQSTDYATAVNACLNVANSGCVGITIWDFTDKYSWIPSVFSGQGAACLFDENLVKKPAYDGVVAALTAGKKSGSASSNVVATTVASTQSASSVVPVSSPVVAVPAISSSAVVSSTIAIPTASGFTTSYIPAQTSSQAAVEPSVSSEIPSATSASAPVATSEPVADEDDCE
ncbi:glycoside hydrolase superfamily [Leptodontidium sp. 2 PMI_412]|nr:glycoside hydrolase superfamily [Leptodontidium sp. 2 PMI_412]